MTEPRPRGWWHGAARVLHEQNPGMSNGEIGRLLGVSRSQVWRALNPERTREMTRRSNAERTVYKREHGRRRMAEGAYAKPCDNPVCSAMCGVKSKHHSTKHCRDCFLAMADVRRTLAEGMWADEWTLREMCATFGVTRAYFVMRRKENGWDLPYRRPPEVVERIRAGTLAGLGRAA